MTISIKSVHTLESLLKVEYHPTLIRLAVWFSIRNSYLIITSAYRNFDRGVHGTDPCRGIDARSWVFDNPQAIADDVNANWVYDPMRLNLKCCVYGDEKHKDHFHLQVCDKTQYITKVK